MFLTDLYLFLLISEAIRSYGRQATPAKLKTTSCNKYCTGTAVMFCSNIIPVSHTEKPQALVRSSVVLLRVLLCDERNDVAHEWPRADNSSKDTDGTIRASKWTVLKAAIAEAGSGKEQTRIPPTPNNLLNPPYVSGFKYSNSSCRSVCFLG